MIENEYALYFDDILMDTFELTDEDFTIMLKSVGAFDFYDQNKDLQETWFNITDGSQIPKITFVNLTTLEKWEKLE